MKAKPKTQNNFFKEAVEFLWKNNEKSFVTILANISLISVKSNLESFKKKSQND